MRRLSAVCIWLFVSVALATAAKPLRTPPMDETGTKFQYQAVVEVDSVSAEELYARARAWVATAYKSAQDVIQMDDQDNLRMICKGNFPVYWNGDLLPVWHTLTIEAKPGRYRYTFADFLLLPPWDRPLENSKGFIGHKKVLNQTADAMDELIQGMTKAMQSPSIAGKSDW